MTLLAETPQAQTTPQLQPDERFFDVLHESTLIRRHVQLFMWLQGDLQTLLPHDLLMVAYGDFSKGRLRYDIISAISGLRSTGFAHADIEDLITGLFNRWTSHGRNAYSLDTASGVILNSSCQCNLHRTLRGMRTLLVQGLRDERAGLDVLYVAFRGNGHFDESSRRMFEILMPHIDCAARRISTLGENGYQREFDSPAPAIDTPPLTDREREILHWVSNGKTNYEIGIILGISPFTVKNHLQRIFRKIDVTNRAQAVSRFEEINRRRQ